MEAFKLKQSAEGPSLFLLEPWRKLNQGLTVGFTSRIGGISEGPWQSFNMGLHVGDEDAHVIANRKRLTEALDWPFDAWTCAEQVHGSNVFTVTSEHRGSGSASLTDVITDCDAIITNEPNILLTSFYADCVPLYFYDTVNGAIGLAHAGWKGTVGEIASKTIQAMSKAYGTRPEELRAAVGPSIGLCCYEVDAVVIERIQALMQALNIKDNGTHTIIKPAHSGKAHIDLKELNRQIMIKAGILPSHIEYSEWCTGCNRNLFFSHRIEGAPSGRMASWIGKYKEVEDEYSHKR